MFSKPEKPTAAIPPEKPNDPKKPALVYDTKGYNEVSPSQKQLKNIFHRSPKVCVYTDNDDYIKHSDGAVTDAK